MQILRRIVRGYLFLVALFTVIGSLAYGVSAAVHGKLIGILILSAFGFVVLTWFAYSLGYSEYD